MNFTIMQFIMFLIAYVCVYSLVDRIMKCIEHCATARAYTKYICTGGLGNMKSFEKGMKEESGLDDMAV